MDAGDRLDGAPPSCSRCGGARDLELRITAGQDLALFATVKAEAAQELGAPDTRLWSPERIRAWREAQAGVAPVALAVLRIPRLGIEVAVLEGTDDATLNRRRPHRGDGAPGRGQRRHRDGFFRPLKDIRVGDRLELETLSETAIYLVDRKSIVDPEDVSVLDPTPAPTVTLVTCYPFYFVVRAVPAHAPPS
jgi:LPXTG-site transpeptidase (sortase) family protein